MITVFVLQNERRLNMVGQKTPNSSNSQYSADSCSESDSGWDSRVFKKS